MPNIHKILAAGGKGAKDWANTFTEVEYLGDRKFAASISTGHRVFRDKADGKWKRHKLTDERSVKGYILLQSAKCCVEVYPYYAKYFDVNHEEVRLYEERWVVQRLFKAPNTWRDVGAWNPIMAVAETENSIVVTVSYTTDYGTLIINYIQRDGSALKHDIAFKNVSNSTETFRVLQRWAGIAGSKVEVQGRKYTITKETTIIGRAFMFSDNENSFKIHENLSSMFEIGKLAPTTLDVHAQGLKADFVYGDWILAQNESLIIDPDTATLNNPTLDGFIMYEAYGTPYYYNDSTFTQIYMATMYTKGSLDRKYRGYVEWNVSSIPVGAIITNTVFKYNGAPSFQRMDCHIHEMLGARPSTSTAQQIYTEAGEGTIYADPVGFPVVATNQDVDLGTSADTDLQNSLAAGWFAIGIQLDSEISWFISEIYSEEYATPTPPPTLYVEYTPPAAAKPSSIVPLMMTLLEEDVI